MESVAAERLNKIGKNPSIVSNREELQEDIHTVNELIMQTTPMASSGSESSLAETDDKKKAKKMKKEKKERDSLSDTLSKITMKKSKSDCYVPGLQKKSERKSPDRPVSSPPPENNHDNGDDESLV